MAIGNITVGTKAIARVGRNAIEVEVIALENGAYRVRNKAGKEFTVRRIEAVPDAVSAVEPAQKIIIPLIEPVVPEISKADEMPNFIPESCKQETTAKHLSLMNAAVEVLRRSEQPLNTREIAAQAIVLGLWTPTGAKTPEQTLYGAIFREMATKEQPRIVKAGQKGKFRLA
ncbi:MAG: hypothetical protein GX280_09240 [Lentisphaerae bacterium]|nr:winged helix-turn-helix domain-containing protein [Victivallaceae bacterium]NLK84242.1 hypothetical protein [Lentisphaerota bacterium]